jgi:subtilisin-like proprotein convertase family protein
VKQIILMLPLMALFLFAKAQDPHAEIQKQTEKFHRKMESAMKEMKDEIKQPASEGTTPGNLVQEHKQLHNNTSQNEIEFRVNRKTDQLELSINGHSTIGNMDIELLTPNGNKMASIHMKNGNYASWSRVVNVKENHSEFTGNWKFTIKTENVTGEFTLRANGN